jgi:Polysaccharide lyase 14
MTRTQIVSTSCAAALILLPATCAGGGVPTTHAAAANTSTGPVPPDQCGGTPHVTPPHLLAFFGPAFSPAGWGSWGLNRMAVTASGDPRFPQMLRVSYPKGSASVAASKKYGIPEGGGQFLLLLRSGSVNDLHLRYYLRFPAGFDFVKGGKLPGLFGGTVICGGYIPNGSNGWSARYMWRQLGAGEVYAYLPTSTTYGTQLGRGNWTWETGTWMCVEQSVHLNTPGKSDGTIRVWVNGREVLKSTRLEFRTTAKLKIQGLFFSTFFGGNDPTWATPRAQHADFAAFAVSSHQVGPLTRHETSTP